MIEDPLELPLQPKKVAIVGPECTGKTSLAQALAKFFATEWVPEYARGYLDKLAIPYTQGDLLNIAQGQMRIEDEFYRDAKAVLFCDTNLLVIKIWSEFKYGKTDPWIINEMSKRQYDLHLLTNIDVPWQEDPQREHPTKRQELFDLYKQALESSKQPYIEIKGTENERLSFATDAVTNLLKHG